MVIGYSPGALCALLNPLFQGSHETFTWHTMGGALEMGCVPDSPLAPEHFCVVILLQSRSPFVAARAFRR